MLRWFLCLTAIWSFGNPTPPLKIVSLAPTLTEIVCELGACERLVGVTDYCTHPPRVRTLPKVGGYINPNLETVLSLKPDLVLALPEHQDTAARLETLGVRVTTLRNWDLQDIFQSIEILGKLLATPEAAQRLSADLHKRQAALTRLRDTPPTCLLVLGHGVTDRLIKEVYVVGRNGFLNEMLQLAGGRNACTQSIPFFPKLGQEALLQIDPDVVIELVPEERVSETQKALKKAAWKTLSHLKAIRNNRYFIINSAHVLQAGPRYGETLADLVAILDSL